MKSYNQYCPIAEAAEVLGDRWTIMIIREFITGSHRFSEFVRGLPGISRSLLMRRLRQLEREGLIERHATSAERRTEYRLTPAGEELKGAIRHLGEWGARWALAEPKPGTLDAPLLLWWMHRRINLDLLPPRRIVVQFDFHGKRKQTLWLVLQQTEASVCLEHPGFEVDLLVSADIAVFYRVWMGKITFAEATDEGSIEVEGPPTLVRAFPRWLQLSHFANIVRETLAREPSEVR